jgi:hypothetical protein
MPTVCPLCEQRKPKRYCPAKIEQICTICCGSKREVEIDCPSNCVYLHAGREHEKGKISPSRRTPPKDPRFYDPEFLKQLSPLITAFNQTILLVRSDFPEMTDADLYESLESLIKTFETQNKGIYYEFTPSAPVPRHLFHAIKQFAENPGGDPQSPARSLKTEVVLDCLNFIKDMLEATALPRPKSRVFLDDIQQFFEGAASSDSDSPIVLP